MRVDPASAVGKAVVDRRLVLKAAGALFSGQAVFCPVQAEEIGLGQLAPYVPYGNLSGSIRLWGHGSFKTDVMGKLVAAWEAGFRQHHPGVRIENQMYGTASAIGALYTGIADIALLGEEISPKNSEGFLRAKHYPPLGIEVATGSLDVAYFDYAHMIFVNQDNPLSQLTLEQLDAVFGAEHRRGPRNIRKWGELGLTGAWADERIVPYSWKDLDFSLFIQEAVLDNSHRWNNDLKEFAHIRRSDGSLYEHGRQMLDALASDRFGIAISNSLFANPNVKALALSRRAGQPYYPASRESLISRDYPLTRVIPAFIDREPGQPVVPKVSGFVRYILSREGQEALVRHTGYLPLNAEIVHEQLKKLL